MTGTGWSYAAGVQKVSHDAVAVYRVFAYLTGILLVFNVFVASPFKYLGGHDTIAAIGWQLHGWAYVLYFVSAAYLAYRLRWGFGRTLLVLLAGTVPFASFVAERRVVRDVRGHVEEDDPVSR